MLTLVNTSIINTSIAFSIGPNVAALDGEDNKKTSEKLQGIDLPVDPLSLYNFVCQVQGLVEKTSD